MVMTRLRQWLLLGMLLLGVPAVRAAPLEYEALARSMGMIWNAMGAIFSFEYVTEANAAGILKFLIFILVLGLVHYGGRAAGFPNKVAGIVAFVVAAITVIFTPNAFIFSAIVALIVPLGLIAGAVWLAFSRFCSGTRFKHLMGVGVLLLALFIAGFSVDVFEEGRGYLSSEYMMELVFMILQEFVTPILLILILVKLVMTVFNAGGNENGGGFGGFVDRFQDNMRNLRRLADTELAARPPSAPEWVRFSLAAPGAVEVSWGPQPQGENVTRYHIQHAYEHERWTNIEVGRGAGQPRQMTIGAVGGAPIDVTRRMQFRVCASARNNRLQKGYGEWAYSPMAVPNPQGTQGQQPPPQPQFQQQLNALAQRLQGVSAGPFRTLESNLRQLQVIDAQFNITVRDLRLPYRNDQQVRQLVDDVRQQIRTAQQELNAIQQELDNIQNNQNFSRITRAELRLYTVCLTELSAHRLMLGRYINAEHAIIT